MIALAVLPVFAVVVAAPAGPDDGCPSARQVTEAMTARFPAFVIAPDPGGTGAGARADVLRALLDVASDGTVVRFSLVDSRGDTQLRRTLPAPGRGRPVAECLALAETLAAIVERYLGTIAYDAADVRLPEVTALPPTASAAAPAASASAAPQPAPRSTFVLLGVGWRMPTGAQPPQGEIEARLGGEVELNSSHPRVAGLISVGVAPRTTTNLDEGRTATLRRFPARLGASIRLPAGPGWVEPALAVGVDLLVISSTAGGAHPRSETLKFSPGVEAAVGYRLKIAGTLYLRPRAAFGLAIRRYDVGVDDAPRSVVFGTPRAYASFGIDTGVLFQ